MTNVITNMDCLAVLGPFSSISVIPRQWEDDNEKLYAVIRLLVLTEFFHKWDSNQ